MKMTSMKKPLAVLAILAAFAVAAMAQVPTRTKIRFIMNVPYTVTMGGYALPAGRYILFEDSQNSNLFRLYETDMTHPPVAVIYAVRGRYWAVRNHSSNTELTLDIDESSHDLHPVLRAFDVPFADSWQIISVTTRPNSLLTRAR